MKIVQNIPSPDGRFTLKMYAGDYEVHFQDGEIDYFNSRGPGQMALNHTFFCLDSADERILFKDFICLYKYGVVDWWDSASRYFCLASGVKELFVFDCKENRYAAIELPVYILSACIKDGVVEIKGGTQLEITDTVQIGGDISSLAYPLSKLEWQTEGIEIKVLYKEEDIIKGIPKQEILDTKKTNKMLKIKQIFKWISSKLKIGTSILVFITCALLLVYLRGIPDVSASTITLLTALILLLFMPDKSEDTDFSGGIYRAWIVRRFVPLTAIVMLVINMTAVFVFPEYKEALVSSLVMAFCFIYPLFALLSEMGNMLKLRDNAEYKKMCKERFRTERKAGKNLLYYVWKANGRKILMFILFCAGIFLLVRLGSYLAASF